MDVHRRVWWLQSAIIGHDVSKGVGADICRILGIGLHELEDREALCLDLPPQERCVRECVGGMRDMRGVVKCVVYISMTASIQTNQPGPKPTSRARLAAHAAQMEAASAELLASPAFQMENDGATAMYIVKVAGGKMIFANNAPHDAIFRTARHTMADYDSRRLLPAMVFSSIICPEDRREYFRGTIRMMFGQGGHRQGDDGARVKPLITASFIKVGGQVRWACKPRLLVKRSRKVGRRPVWSSICMCTYGS